MLLGEETFFSVLRQYFKVCGILFPLCIIAYYFTDIFDLVSYFTPSLGCILNFVWTALVHLAYWMFEFVPILYYTLSYLIWILYESLQYIFDFLEYFHDFLEYLYKVYKGKPANECTADELKYRRGWSDAEIEEWHGVGLRKKINS